MDNMKKTILYCCVVLALIGSVECSADNILPNGSFEVTTVPDVPDCFDHYLGPKKVKDWYSAWNMDSKYFYHGEKSLRLDISSIAQKGKITVRPMLHPLAIKRRNWVSPENGKVYTFSLYLKSDKRNFPVTIRYIKRHRIFVGKEWQRFVFSEKIKIKKRRFIDFAIVPAGIGKLWIDALQIEKGGGATVFQPAGCDKDLFPFPEPENKASLKKEIDKLKGKKELKIKTDRSFYSVEDRCSLIVENMDLLKPDERSIHVSLHKKNNTTEGGGKVNYDATGLKITDNRVEMDLRPLANGKYTVILNFTDKNGRMIQKAETDIVKQAPKPGEVKIDYTKRILLVDNRPFLFIGACFLRVHENYENFPGLLDQIKKKGYSVIISNFTSKMNDQRADRAQIKRFLDVAHKTGLRVVPWLRPNAVKGKDGKLKQIRKFDPEKVLEGYINEVNTIILPFKDHPSIIAWYLFDEVYGKLINAGFTKKLVEYARKIDPYHPMIVNYGDLQKEYLFYDHSVPADIVAQTQYSVPIGPLSNYAKRTSIETLAAEGKKPVFLWLQLWAGLGRYPTPEEFSCMTYLALTNGATGIMTWPMMPSSKILWDHMGQVSKELNMLFPIMAGNNNLDQNIVQSDTEYVHWIARINDEHLYVIAVNSAPFAQTTDFHITEDFEKDKFIDVIFENRNLRIHNHGFSDTFAPYERHVYKLKPIGPF